MIKMAVGKFSHLPVVQTSINPREGQFPSNSIQSENDREEIKIREFAHKESNLKPDRRQQALNQQQEICERKQRQQTQPNEDTVQANARYLVESSMRSEGDTSYSESPSSHTAPAEMRVIGVVSIGDIIHTMLEENSTAMRYMQEYMAGDYSVTSLPRHQSVHSSEPSSSSARGTLPSHQ